MVKDNNKINGKNNNIFVYLLRFSIDVKDKYYNMKINTII